MSLIDLLAQEKFILFDGGLGTLLQSKGLPPGEMPELFALRREESLLECHKAYLEAGAHIITTNTFGANRLKLPASVNIYEVNKQLAKLAKLAVQDKALVAGSVGPTGKMVKPLGELSFGELVEIYKEQIQGLVEGGVDFILAETHFDLAEAKAVVIAAREVANIPVGVSMTFEGKVSLTGTSPEVFALTMNNLGVDLIGINCSLGPVELVPVVETLLDYAQVPVLVQPNAGLPVLEGDRTVFKLAPEPFAKDMMVFAKLGVKGLGGCCGTTPSHIKALAQELTQVKCVTTSRQIQGLALTSRSKYVFLGQEHPPVLIGERINPTGKKELTLELQEGNLSKAIELAEEQIKAKAQVLDVNVGAPLVEEEKILPRLSLELVKRFDPILCFDSSKVEAIEKSLQIYPGSPLVNSISGEKDKLEILGPLCKKYGAPFILLPLKGKKLPVSAKERIEIIEDMLGRCEELAIPKRLILVDALALTVSSKPEAAKACLEVIKYCAHRGLPTTLGLSNISFGLPARELINSTFLAMGLALGLSSCIVNPNSWKIKEVFYASNVLLNKDKQAKEFIAHFSDWEASKEIIKSKEKKDVEIKSVKDAVVCGDKEKVIFFLQQELKKGRKAFELLNEELIPGITLVGDKYEKKEYYLPQLLLSAEAMQEGVKLLEPLLKEDKQEKGPKIVMATVEGDIHDIGKNIVCLMLRNHGFEVIDLGKDVPAQKIVEVAKKEKAPLIGLSALMTTTMIRMEDTIKLVKQENLNCKVMIGGAVVTQAFADKIGADGYSENAVAAVKLAKKLLNLRE